MTTPDPPGESPQDDPPGNRFIKPGGKLDAEGIRTALEATEDETLEEGLRRVRFELSRDLNKRLDKYLTDRITFMSRTQLARLVEVGGVTVNGRSCKPSTKLRLGDVVDVVVPPPPATEIQPEAIPLDIIYEDEHLVVVNKQPDLIVHPARSHHSGTLLNALVHHFQQSGGGADTLSGLGKDLARPGIVHRLDRDTSGVMVVAKDDESHWLLGRQFEHRTTDKRYLAVVEGIVEPDADVIDVPLGPHISKAKGLRERQMVRHDEFGKPAVTLYRVRERYTVRADHPSSFKGYTLVELELKTGRTHQIRVHLAHIGAPIVGDDMYGGPLLNLSHLDPAAPADPVMHRQALHAATLGIEHPIERTPVRFAAPLPPDLRALIRLLRTHRVPSGVQTFPGCTVDLEAAMSGDRRRSPDIEAT
ncbi:MAG: RluA family pseudouridine synthase [Planctomycetota bacterium]